MPGNETPAHFSVELDQIPVGAALDALRTVRNDFAPGLQAAGLVSGKIGYAPQSADVATTAKTASKNPRHQRTGPGRMRSRGAAYGQPYVQGFPVERRRHRPNRSGSKVVLEAVSTAATLTQGDSMALQTPSLASRGAKPLTISAGCALRVYGQVAGANKHYSAEGMAHVAGFAALKPWMRWPEAPSILT